MLVHASAPGDVLDARAREPFGGELIERGIQEQLPRALRVALPLVATWRTTPLARPVTVFLHGGPLILMSPVGGGSTALILSFNQMVDKFIHMVDNAIRR
ncbi:MAG TPA: hypothetical protein VKZ96_01915, partial [Thermomicrobiales bacterium]|nr:hypothetical protein [Thermomicrobiales bacterium]